MSKTYYVYWYRLDTHTDPYSEGYVGVSTWLSRRNYQHRVGKSGGSIILSQALKKYGERVTREILFQTTDKESAYQKEFMLRPTKEIGWNIAIGGGMPPDCSGRVDSPETRLKRAEAVRRTKALRKYPSIFKGVTGRWTDEQRALLGSYHKGKTISEAHKQAITEKMTGENSPKAKEVFLVHKDVPSEIKTFGCIREAADSLGIGYQALRSQYQRAHADCESKGPDRKGWVLLHGSDIENPIGTVQRRLQFQAETRRKAIEKREAKRQQKALSSDQG